eukprot:CAMPEP_0172739948 /NCGR_PEP_ID=MMETSP1074-20121228/123732_1 /TAXON_ID=2916 /ORGANISM="Ceratium fusus, Strain PA161109" /LENGTH=69 /DNA_ID=CAMNT_0013569945 /DNA_START=92 /DNA_END=297 /DNA_ORIENTATION=+
MLREFHGRTLDPSGEQGRPEGTRKKPRANGNPFDLYVSSREVYMPNSGWWEQQWNDKRSNVENWHVCET